MILRYRLLILLLCVSATACVPAASNTTTPQTTDVVETFAAAHEVENDHAEDSHTADRSNADADEHGDGGRSERRELGPHEHGAATLLIAWSGSDVAIDLETPAYNILGFEYAPTSEEEKALLADGLATLEAGELLQLNPDAECSLVSATVQTGFNEEADSEKTHREETHSDIDVSYNLECRQPENIAELDAGELFAHFPNFADIVVQWISDTQQSAADLTPDNPVISFK